MKDKLMMFVIGVLVGAIVATGAFYIYTSTNSNDFRDNNMQMNGGQPPELPSGQNGQPPEKPDGQMPEQPSENNSQSENN